MANQIMQAVAARYGRMHSHPPVVPAQTPQQQTAETPAPTQETPAQDQAVLSSATMYNLKFDFFFEKVNSTSRSATFLQGDQARSVSHSLYQKVSSRFSMDFSFLSTLAEQTGRAAAIDEETYNKFVEAANGLANLDQQSLQDFLGAVDDLFNAAEQAFGLGDTGLDSFADLAKSAVTDYFDQVTASVQQMNTLAETDRQSFQQDLQKLLEPAQSENTRVADFRKQLTAAGVPDRQQTAILKLAKLIERFAKKHRSDEVQQLYDKLGELVDKLANRQADSSVQPEQSQPSASQAKALQVYEHTVSQQRVAVNVEQTQIDLLAA